MKKVCALLLGLLIMSACSQEQPKNYMTLSGQLENNKDSILTIGNKKEVVKEINISTAGTFKDTLKIKTGAIYTIQTGNNRAAIYLKNGFNISLKGDAENLMKSLKFS